MGYDLLESDRLPNETQPDEVGGDPELVTSHGTHVAGIIANVAPGATLYSYRVLGPDGIGDAIGILFGIDQAVLDNMDVINLSLGVNVNDSDNILAHALNNAMDAGVVAIAANGNFGLDGDFSIGSPAASLKAISVGASYPQYDGSGNLIAETIADFSSRGPAYGSLTIKPDVVAPGQNITSTVPWFYVGNEQGVYTDSQGNMNALATFHGTSMAAPHVSGAAAILLQKYPDWTPYDIKAVFMNTAVQLFDGNGDRYRLNEQGAGRIDITAALDSKALVQSEEEARFNGLFENYLSSSISFGHVTVGQDVYRNVVVKDVSGAQQAYDLDVIWYSSTPDKASVTLDVYSVNHDANGNANFNVVLSTTDGLVEGFYEGAVTVSNAEQTILVPFSFYYGPYLGNPIANLWFNNETFISTNTLPISYGFELLADVEDVKVSLFELHTVSNGIVNEPGPLTKGTYQLEFSEMTNSSGEVVPLVDGYYILETSVMYNGTRYNFIRGFIYADDVEGPQITLDGGFQQETSNSSITLTGSVSDKLFDVLYLFYPQSFATVYYQVENSNGTTAKETVYFDANLSFQIQVDLADGVNTVYFETVDEFNNTDQFQATVTKVAQSTPTPTPTPSPSPIMVPDEDSTSETESEDYVKKEIKKNETTKITLPNGLSLDIPSDAVGLGKTFGVISKLSEEETADVLTGRTLDSAIKAYGTAYDFHILNENGEIVEGVQFKFPVKLSIPIGELDIEDLNPEKLSVFKLHDDGTVELIGGRLVNGELVAYLNSFSRYMVMAKDKKFDDVTAANYSWAVNEIEVLASKDIIKGKTDSEFDPSGNITRAEFASMLVRMLGLQMTSNDQLEFKDVSENAWYFNEVQIAASHGLITGYHDSTFAPTKNITRGEMAVILSRALKYLGVGVTSQNVLTHFSDQHQIKSWAKNDVALVVNTGIMNGTSNESFSANELSNRAQAAVVIYRLYTERYNQ